MHQQINVYQSMNNTQIGIIKQKNILIDEEFGLF
jgi:hypothetical protein